jgi:hypothetical protein
MKKLVIAVFTSSLLLGMSALAAEKGTWTGVVADEKCASAGKTSGAECAKKCIGEGSAAVLVTDKKEVLRINNADAIKGHEGHNVKITGTLDGKNLHVDNLQMAAKAAPAGEHNQGEHKH